ncbi:hypothetical protein HRI_000367800 [Hibiscus trionum]|uniref:NAD-dependent epimerase/dehydratase domain-containing protein n=2 Tax=Hibiscus trionum TaxID=183268 RepID=A0A9W7GZZ7_HIBTR|nr:hypothetical protein HRI_000367800 [Hibiscus trionum]
MKQTRQKVHTNARIGLRYKGDVRRRLEMNAAEKVVCMTGASGFIASWLVKLLLQRGYTVRATVGDPNEPKKTEHLVSLDGAKERLHLFKGCFDSIVDGAKKERKKTS